MFVSSPFSCFRRWFNFVMGTAWQPDDLLHPDKSKGCASEGVPSTKCSGFCLGESQNKIQLACNWFFFSLIKKSLLENVDFLQKLFSTLKIERWGSNTVKILRDQHFNCIMYLFKLPALSMDAETPGCPCWGCISYCDSVTGKNLKNKCCLSVQQPPGTHWYMLENPRSQRCPSTSRLCSQQLGSGGERTSATLNNPVRAQYCSKLAMPSCALQQN